MPAVDVTIIDQGISDGLKQEIATRLCDVLVTYDLGRTNRHRTRWHVVAQAVRSTAKPVRGPGQRVADLDYAAWHAHLAGVRRWAPDRSSEATS